MPEKLSKAERKHKFYNLDAIISVGYRIKSQIATKFRIWATQRLKYLMDRMDKHGLKGEDIFLEMHYRSRRYIAA